MQQRRLKNWRLSRLLVFRETVPVSKHFFMKLKVVTFGATGRDSDVERCKGNSQQARAQLFLGHHVAGSYGWRSDQSYGGNVACAQHLGEADEASSHGASDNSMYVEMTKRVKPVETGATIIWMRT